MRGSTDVASIHSPGPWSPPPIGPSPSIVGIQMQDGAARTLIGGFTSTPGAGAGNVVIGGALTHDLAGASPNLILAGGTSTGISFGTKFDYSVSLVAETAGPIASQTYTINHLVNGSSILSVPGQSIAASNGNANDTYLQGIVQDTDGNTFGHSNFTYEGFVLSTTVPEPSAALLGALGMLGLVRRRR